MGEWSKEFTAMRKLGREHNDAEFFMRIAKSRSAETIANMAIILINQADYLLYRQLKALESHFLENGGFSERMTALRLKKRNNLK